MPVLPVCMTKPAKQIPKKIRHDSSAVFTVSVGDVDNGLKTDFPLEYNDAKYQHWVNQRMSFRRELDRLGDLTNWINSKPTVTELEMLVVEREKKTQKIPSPASACAHPSGWANVPCANAVRVWSTQHKLKEAKWNTGTYKRQPSEIIKGLDRPGRGCFSRNALQAVFDKDAVVEVPQQLKDLVSSQRGVEGQLAALKSLANGINTWSHEREERGNSIMPGYGELDLALELGKLGNRAIERVMRAREQRDLSTTARRPIWSCDPKQRSGRRGAQLLSLPSSENLTQQHHTGRTMEGIQDEEEDVMRTECTGEPVQAVHTQPSSLGGNTAQMVHRFRRQTLGEYLGSMDKCQRKKVTVSQATLERALLHPGDHALGAPEGSALRQAGSNPMPRFGGHLLATPHNVHKETNMREPSCSRADPNAFWPGQENHVRLYLPRVCLSHEEVLFEHIVRSPAPSPGHWPINDKGYSTSGDIDGQKTYIL